MIIECPECGMKNITDKPPQPGKRYRCGKCGAVITFLQAVNTQERLTQTIKEKPPLNWFQRHLNWISILSIIALFPLGYITGVAIIFINPYMSTVAYYSIVYIIAALWLIGIDGWVLRRKNRSLWNLLLLIIPFCWIMFPFLENKSRVSTDEVFNDK